MNSLHSSRRTLSSSQFDEAVDRVFDRIFSLFPFFPNPSVLDSLFPFFPNLDDLDDERDQDPIPYDRQERLRQEIWNIRRLLRTATSGDVEETITKLLQYLSENKERWQKAVIVWLDLIEVLIQTEEKKFGAKPGLGQLKKAEVKEVTKYLLNSSHFRIPRIPDFLMPAVMEIGVDWVVDTIVFLANQYGLWQEPQTYTEDRKPLLVVIKAWFKKILKPFLIAAAWVGTKIWQLFEERMELSPKVRLALEAIERDGLIVDEGDVLKGVSSLIEWIASHRPQLTAMSDLVFAAVQEAESYITLSGPEKKDYAIDLLFAVLDQLGFKERAGLLFALIYSMADTGIEVAVHLFNKEGVFTHE